MFEKEQVRGLTAGKILIYAAISFVLAVFQSTVGARIGFFGATPQLTLALTCAAGCFYGAPTGAVVGLLSGLFTDAVGSAGIPLLALFYAVFGYFLGLYTADKRQTRAGLGIWSIALAATVGVGVFITLLCLLVNAGKANIVFVVLNIALPEALNTYVFGWMIGVFHLFVDRVNEKNKKQQ